MGAGTQAIFTPGGLMSNWLQATAARAKQIEAELICKKCGEANRPSGPNLIELDSRSFTANCAVCGAIWRVEPDAV